MSAGELSPPRSVEPSFWHGRRVLVTGHTGFKGAWLSLWLQSLGAELTGVSLDVPTDPSLYELARVGEGMTSIQADIRDAGALAGAVAGADPEVVIHMAAQSLVRRSFAEPRETYETNVIGTVNVLEAVRATDARVLVNVTSDKCYENREWEWGYRETDPMGGHDPYSSSKGCAELVAAAYRRSFFAPEGRTRLASARAGNVIGGGDWGEDRLVPDLMRAALAGEQALIRNPNSIRPWQHVLSPLSGYLVLAQALFQENEEESPPAVNFGPLQEDVRPVGAIVERLAELWPDAVRWRLDEGPHPHEARFLALDSSLARTRLGWRPLGRLEGALRSIVEWYRALVAGEDMRAVTLGQIESLQYPDGST